ncbi:MAG TPA: SGNH/GDSL hydrolase family protein [Hyphomicrobiaceae bacterium]|nr:SGNH/GDSL hydrolase family protein [Hyphomicrobiaceae bacterium]
MLYVPPSAWLLSFALTLLPVASSAQELTPVAAPKLEAAATPADPLSTKATPAFGKQLPRVGRALRETRTAKVLAIGSSSTAGIGASSPTRTYTARLEVDLEQALTGTDFDVVSHGLGGEVAQGAADRMKREVEEVKPDLVIWQVGTNDAFRHVAIDSFKICLRKTLAWLKEQQVDVILINPQYGDQLIKDAYYEDMVNAVAEVARDADVLLVDRFQLMKKLQREHTDRLYLSADNLHMNDEGYRCLAEELTATIIKALPQPTHTTASVVTPAPGAGLSLP